MPAGNNDGVEELGTRRQPLSRAVRLSATDPQHRRVARHHHVAVIGVDGRSDQRRGKRERPVVVVQIHVVNGAVGQRRATGLTVCRIERRHAIVGRGLSRNPFAGHRHHAGSRTVLRATEPERGFCAFTKRLVRPQGHQGRGGPRQVHILHDLIELNPDKAVLSEVVKVIPERATNAHGVGIGVGAGVFERDSRAFTRPYFCVLPKHLRNDKLAGVKIRQAPLRQTERLIAVKLTAEEQIVNAAANEQMATVAVLPRHLLADQPDAATRPTGDVLSHVLINREAARLQLDQLALAAHAARARLIVSHLANRIAGQRVLSRNTSPATRRRARRRRGCDGVGIGVNHDVDAILPVDRHTTDSRRSGNSNQRASRCTVTGMGDRDSR